MPDLLKAILLGIVEGITEFLPISSTGHLIVASALLDFNTTLGSTFEVAIQFGSLVAVFLFYKHELLNHLRAIRTDGETQHFWVQIVKALLPAAIIGFLLRDFIKDILFSPLVVALALIVGGIVLVLVERLFGRRELEYQMAVRNGVQVKTAEATVITSRQTLIIGLAQMLALVPGVSRSGASIVGGMLAGMERGQATRFSFYLALPMLGATTLFDLLSSLRHIQMHDLAYLLLGTLVSAVVAWAAIGWLLRYVARNSLAPFGYYRIVAGAGILLLIAVSWLPADIR